MCPSRARTEGGERNTRFWADCRSTSSARLLFSSLARPHYHQIRAADFQARGTAKGNYNRDGRISDGNSKTLVDRDGGSGCVCEAGSSSVEFHPDDGHRTVCGKSSSKG